MSANKDREFDLVIFGATGFTGFFIARELVLSIDEKPSEYGKLKWAIAGRNLAKLDEVLRKVGNELNKDLSSIAKIEADVSNEQSLQSMAERAKLVINAVGPYRFYGKQVVDACVRSGTHHIDLSGEPIFIEQTQLDYDAKAVQNNALIISTCGWDSIPVDLGVHFLKRNFSGKLHSVETFVGIHPGPEGYGINFGTFHSALFIVTDFFKYPQIHSRLYRELLTEKLPESGSNLPLRVLPFSRPEFTGWNVMFLGADKPVVERTQHYNYVHHKEAPVLIQTYFTFKHFVNLTKVLLLAAVFGPLTFLRPGRALLERYPHVFTLGRFSKSGPTRAQIDTTRFTTRLIGKGWSKQEADPSDKLDKQMTVLVSGRDPGYLATSVCIVQSGLTILTETHKMPKGGVLTPASAFRDTSLVEKLQNRGIKFEIVE